MKLKPLSFILILCLHSKLGIAQSPLDSNIDPVVQDKIKTLLQTQKDIKLKQYDSQLIEINLGVKTLFASSDGKYLFASPIIDTQNKTNIVELKDKQNRKSKLENLPQEMRLSFPASNQSKHTITLFTDIDCGYCRRFHQQIPELSAKGINVNYIMLPRAGINSASFEKTNSVLCSSSPQHDMTLAMKNQFNAKNTCNSSLKEQVVLAHEFGINSTPTIILPDGTINIGYLSSQQIIQILN